MNQLLKGKISEFSLDALVNLATCAGMRVGLWRISNYSKNDSCALLVGAPEGAIGWRGKQRKS